MSDPFAVAIVALFNGPGSDEARYTPRGGPQRTVRTILGQPDRVAELTQGRVIVAENQIALLQSEVSTPTEGEQLEIVRDGSVFLTLQLSGEAHSDLERLSWTMGAVEG